MRRLSQQIKYEKVVKSAISQRSGDGLEGAEGWETLARSMQRKENEGRSLRMGMARPEQEVHPRKQSRGRRVAERRQYSGDGQVQNVASAFFSQELLGGFIGSSFRRMREGRSSNAVVKGVDGE